MELKIATFAWEGRQCLWLSHSFGLPPFMHWNNVASEIIAVWQENIWVWVGSAKAGVSCGMTVQAKVKFWLTDFKVEVGQDDLTTTCSKTNEQSQSQLKKVNIIFRSCDCQSFWIVCHWLCARFSWARTVLVSDCGWFQAVLALLGNKEGLFIQQNARFAST